MSNQKKPQPNTIIFDIDSPPLDSDQLASLRSSLREKYFIHLNGVITLIVLAALVTLKVISLDFEQDRELLHISFYIGCGIGLFSGISVKGNSLMRLQIIIVGMVVCSAAGLGASMLMTLLLGYTPSWISSINIIASAMASMWLLTYYDETVKAISSIKHVNHTQLDYIIKAANHFDSLMKYAKSIHKKEREPVMGEYWVIRDWVDDNKYKSSDDNS